MNRLLILAAVVIIVVGGLYWYVESHLSHTFAPAGVGADATDSSTQ